VKSKQRQGDPRAAQTLKAQLRVRQLILDGAWRAGERVPELRLVERTGISRTPIRAALVRLAEEGLLESLPSGGFVVRAFDEDEVLDAIDLRGTLEGLAARRAAQRRPSHTELSDLRDCVGALDALISSARLGIEQFSDYVRLNQHYHALLVELAQSRVLSREIERIVALPFASPSAFVLVQAALPDARQTLTIGQEHHRSILDAISVGDSVRAESVAREHSNLAKRNLLAATASAGEALPKIAGAHLIRRQPS
jgi:GntR family transcriptional regulator, vanillate catabolism transcriptional regulator